MYLAVADHRQGVFVYLGDGNGNWEVVARAAFPRQLVPRDSDRDLYVGAEDLTLADANGDGYPDLIVGACDEGATVAVGGFLRLAVAYRKQGWRLRLE